MYNYEKYGFNLTLKSRILSMLIYVLLFGIEITIAVLMHLKKLESLEYIPYIVMIIVLVLFFIILFRCDIRTYLHNRGVRKDIERNISLPQNYVSEYFLAKDNETQKYSVLFLAYNKVNEGRANFLYSDSLLTLGLDRFGDVLFKKNNSYKINNYLVDMNNQNIDIQNMPITELSYYCKNKKFSTVKTTIFSSIFYSIFIKFLLFAILAVVLTISLELINGVLVSTIAMFSIDKIFSWLMGVGNIQIRNVANVESQYTVLNIGNKEYTLRTNDVRFLYEDFSDNERNTR